MFDGNKAGNQAQDMSRSALRLQKNFFVRNELLGRGRDRAIADDGHFGHVQLGCVRVVGKSLRPSHDVQKRENNGHLETTT